MIAATPPYAGLQMRAPSRGSLAAVFYFTSPCASRQPGRGSLQATGAATVVRLSGKILKCSWPCSPRVLISRRGRRKIFKMAMITISSPAPQAAATTRRHALVGLWRRVCRYFRAIAPPFCFLVVDMLIFGFEGRATPYAYAASRACRARCSRC